jgi:mRNA degradation ribonuclease J1/J2
LGYCEKHNVTLEKIHASGHATATELRSLARAVNPGTLIPVHCEDPAGFRRIFPRVMAVADGNPIEL